MKTDLPVTPDCPTDSFLPLPGWNGSDGATRRAGIEIEFGGLTERTAAGIAADTLGGTVREREQGSFTVADTAIGDLEIYLDTVLRKKLSGTVARTGLDAGRAVIPVELVTPPLAQSDLPRLETLVRALRDAGGIGTRGGVLLGFGLHLNPELADPDGADLAATGTAYAFLEDWLRHADPVDVSRRVLPFTDRYRPGWLDALAAPKALPGRDAFIDAYLDHVHTRNHGLDLLPAIRSLAPDRFEATHGKDDSVSARPAYHYRLPDCRLGDPGWSVAYEWNRWALVERAARDADLLDALRAAWRERGWLANRTRSHWADTAGDLLRQAGHLAEPAG